MAKEIRPKTYTTAITDTTRTAIYTCPANTRAKVVALNIAPNSGTSVTSTLEIYKDSVYYSLDVDLPLTGSSVPESLYEEVEIYLEAADNLSVTLAGTSPDVDFMVTVEETFIPLG